MDSFTPFSALAGGMAIGLASVLLLLAAGQIAGISGIVGGLFPPVQRGDIGWRVAFLLGLILGPLLVAGVTGTRPTVAMTASPTLLVIAGLLVGYGTQLGSGCTSGHGVCGIARLSQRSFAAVAILLVTAIATVFVARHVIGG